MAGTAVSDAACGDDRDRTRRDPEPLTWQGHAHDCPHQTRPLVRSTGPTASTTADTVAWLRSRRWVGVGGDGRARAAPRRADGRLRDLLHPAGRYSPGLERHRVGRPQRSRSHLQPAAGQRGHQQLPPRRAGRRHHFLHHDNGRSDRARAARHSDRLVDGPRDHRHPPRRRRRRPMTPATRASRCRVWWAGAAGRCRDDRGSATGWALLTVLVVALLAGAVLDGGDAMAARVQALDIAQQAARSGANQLDLAALRTSGLVRFDPVAAETAARQFLAEAGATGTVTATAHAVPATGP